jgi:hypothetical protein
MLCGLKWKTCNCPWFSYETVERDRLNHMRVPEDDNFPNMNFFNRRAARMPPPPPRMYREEPMDRRRQDILDEDLARMMQNLGVRDNGDNGDYFGGIHGIGNAGGHFMNEDFRRPAPARTNPAAAAANYAMGMNRHRDVPPPPRAAERLVPRRPRMDYATEAGRHAPVAAPAPRPASVVDRRASMLRPAPRPSVLAGLGGAGRGSGRVGAWRAHVQPGVIPDEGVLSM